MGTIAEEGNIIDWWEVTYKPLSEKGYMDIADKLIENFEILRKNVSIEHGQCPVIFSPMAIPFLFMYLEGGLGGELVRKKLSPLTGKLGQKIFSDKLTIIDDGLLKDGGNTAPFDDEGVLSQKTLLVENGVLKSYLLNLKNSFLLNMPCTGNGLRHKPIMGERSYDVKPGTGFTNVFIQPGDSSYEDMIGDIKNGLLLEISEDIWMGNQETGDFSGTVHIGKKIENGKIIGRVKDVTIAGNIYNLLNEQLVAVGNKIITPNSISDAYHVPYLYFKDVSIN